MLTAGPCQGYLPGTKKSLGATFLAYFKIVTKPGISPCWLHDVVFRASHDFID
jgi:hypothetical protein